MYVYVCRAWKYKIGNMMEEVWKERWRQKVVEYIWNESSEKDYLRREKKPEKGEKGAGKGNVWWAIKNEL